MTTYESNCGPLVRNRQAFADYGYALTLIDHASDESVGEYDDIFEVILRPRPRCGADVARRGQLGDRTRSGADQTVVQRFRRQQRRLRLPPFQGLDARFVQTVTGFIDAHGADLGSAPPAALAVEFYNASLDHYS